MKKEINDFLEEITTNFTELFIETYFIRFLSNFDSNYLLEATDKMQVLLNTKLNEKIKNYLKEINLDSK